MILKKLITIFLFIIITSGLVTLPIFGQVVTPSLNIISKPVMPAVSSWLKKNSVGGEYKDGNGKRELDGQEIYDLEVEGSLGVIAFSMGSLDIDAYVNEARYNVENDATYDGIYLNDLSETYISLSLTGQGNVTIGLAMHNVKKNVFDSSADYEDFNVEQSGIIGSFSVKVFDFLYIGAGLERITESSDITIDNEWTEATGGIAFWFGQDTDTQLRVEASVTESPKAESEAEPTDEKFSAEHANHRITRVNVDLMMNGLLFTYANLNQITFEETVNSSTGESVDQSEKIVNEGSVQWMPEEGLILGFAFESSEYKEVFSDRIDSFKVNLGFIF